jgi:hypothetical protein
MSLIDENLKYLIINDILIEILSNLNVKQLLRLERVSKQFQNCVYYALKRQKSLVHRKRQGIYSMRLSEDLRNDN